MRGYLDESEWPPKEQSSDGASRHNIHQEVAEGASPVVLVVLAPSRALLVSMPPGPPRAADSLEEG